MIRSILFKLSTTFGKCFCTVVQEDNGASEDKIKSEDQ